MHIAKNLGGDDHRNDTQEGSVKHHRNGVEHLPKAHEVVAIVPQDPHQVLEGEENKSHCTIEQNEGFQAPQCVFVKAKTPAFIRR